MSTDAPAAAPREGSWIPLMLVSILLIFRRICYGEGGRPIQLRRWYNLQVCCANPVNILPLFGGDQTNSGVFASIARIVRSRRIVALTYLCRVLSPSNFSCNILVLS